MFSGNASMDVNWFVGIFVLAWLDASFTMANIHSNLICLDQLQLKEGIM